MRVFVTGATGFVGSAIVQDLLNAGHEVIGLTRSEAGAQSLRAMGATAHRGDLDDLDSLRRGAALADGVIHTAFNHDFSKFAANCEADRGVVAALGDAILDTGGLLIVTCASALLAPGRLAVEDIIPTFETHPFPRVASEVAAASVAARGGRVAVVRLPPSVHGDGDHGFVPLLITLARQKGVSAYVDEGSNLWPAVHRYDAARLYRLALETGAADARYHAIAEEGIPFRDIASVIGRRLNLPVVRKSAEEAAAHFGWFTHFAAIDCPASSAQTQKALNWQPTHAGLIADLDRPRYFEA